MAIKGAKTGDKRKATVSADKGIKKAPAKTAPASTKQNGPESTRKMWRNDDASNDSSDDDGDLSDGDDAGAALPAKKKVRQEDGDVSQNAGKKVEKSTLPGPEILTMPQSYTDLTLQ